MLAAQFGKIALRSSLFSRFEIFEPPLFCTECASAYAKLSLRTRTSTHVLQNCFEVEARLVNMRTLKTIMAKRLKGRAEDVYIKLEYPRVCKVPQQRLKKCLESKWDVTVNKLKKPRNLCKRTSTDLSLLSIPGTLTAFNNLEWCHYAGIILKETSCNEEKIRRQQIKKGEVTSFKTVTSIEEPHVEVESINQGEKLHGNRSQKLIRPCLKGTSMHS